MTVHALGRRVNHDPRSLTFPAARRAVVRPVMHRTFGPVLNQGDVGACTGFTAAHCLNSHGARDVGDRINKATDALAIYSGATTLDPWDGEYPPDDTGSDANSVAKWLRAQGRITSWAHCFGLDHVLEALALGPVMLGCEWHQGMFTPDPTGRIRPDGNIAGGHETLLRGFDGKTLVTGRNSWGPDWGVRGHYKIHVDDLDVLLRARGDATVLHRTG